jgi:hypothetical protein
MRRENPLSSIARILIMINGSCNVITNAHSRIPDLKLLQMYVMLQVRYTVTAAGADASSIYLESFSFSLLCTIEYTHTVLPNFHIVTLNSTNQHRPSQAV